MLITDFDPIDIQTNDAQSSDGQNIKIKTMP